MAGGMLQLVAYGVQDVHLFGMPEFTLWKAAYKRITHFAIESKELPFSGNTGFGKTATIVIPRDGDLLYKTKLRIVIPSVTPTSGKNFRWLNFLGHVVVKNFKLEIGPNEIDKQYGEWLHIWDELTNGSLAEHITRADLVGNVPKLVQPSTSTKPEMELFVDLPFFFTRNPGLALPLIALQYYETKITVEFRDKNLCYWSENGTEANVGDFTATLMCDYIYLDTYEKRKFATKSHEYLIEQLQFSNDESITTATGNSIRLSYSHPVKYMVWVVQKDNHVNRTQMQDAGGPQWFNYTDRVDTTGFSGTPADPLGGGIPGGPLAHINPFWSLAYGTGVNAPNTGALSGSDRNVAMALANNANNDVNLDDLAFQDLFGNGNTSDAVGWNADLPVFDSGYNCCASAKIKFNGQDRFAERTGRYFNKVHPIEYGFNTPAIGVNLYSFSLRPLDHQPTGSANFSRINTATLELTTTANTVLDENASSPGPASAKYRGYSINYNVLRIMSGMAGVAYQG